MKLLVYVYLNFIINEVLRLFGATRDVIFIQSKQFFCSPFFRHREYPLEIEKRTFRRKCYPFLGEKELCWGNYTAIGCSKISFSVDEMPIRRKFR